MSEEIKRDGFAACPTCKQYNHSIGDDQLADAFNHFQSMFSHRGDGIPTQHCFDEKTRNAAQVLMAAARAHDGDGRRPGLRRVVHELRLSERVFRDYAQQHEDKAEAAIGTREAEERMRKAKRNRERADACKAALDAFAAPPQSTLEQEKRG